MVALGLSVTFMYLILAAQFESWVHPISILSGLPVTIPFGLLSLLLFRTPLDLYAMLMAAMIPIALGQGPGASARASMAKVIIGGQALSLVLSLVATPVMYSLLDDAKSFLGRRFRWLRQALIPASSEA
jgi:HAE1 family hydrophobic/amphiphilic exporter-1